MSEQKYCSIFDDLHRHKEIDAPKLMMLLAQHCLTGLLSNRVVKRTFLAPNKKLTDKLMKMSVSDVKKQLKRHILRGFHQPKTLTENRQVFSMSDDGYILNRKNPKEITLKAGAKTLTAEFLGTRHNQALYLVSEALPAHAQKLPPELRKKSKSRSRSRSKSKRRADSDPEMEGGTPTATKLGGFMYGGTPTATKLGGSMYGGTPTATKLGGADDEDDDDDTDSEEEEDHSGGDALAAFAQDPSYPNSFDFPHGMRNLIFDQYYQKYGDLYPLTVQDNWSALLYGNLLMYMNEHIPDFRTDYLPFLGNDPLSSLEILLQRYDPNVSSDNAILSDTFLRGFMRSPTYLTDDFGVLREARSLLLSFCQDGFVPGVCMEDTTYMSSNVLDRERSALNELLGSNAVLMLGGSRGGRQVGLGMKGGNRQSGGDFADLAGVLGAQGWSGNPLLATLDPNKERQLRQGIVAIYKRVSGEPDRFAPGTKAIFKKVYEQRDTPVYQGMLYNDLLRYMSMSLRDTTPQVYGSAMSNLFGYPASVANDRILQYGLDTGLSSGSYAFPAGVVYDFTQSPNFLHMMSQALRMEDFPVPPFVIGKDYPGIQREMVVYSKKERDDPFNALMP